MKTFVILALAGAAIAAPPQQQRARRADCSSYTSEQQCDDEAPTSANCVWAVRTPDGDYDDRTCQPKSCVTINNQKDDQAIEGECKSLAGCTWDADNYYCLKTGDSLPCFMSYPDPDKQECPSNCDYSSITEGCITKGSTPQCSVIYEEESCKAQAGCEFNENVYKCWKAGEKIPCGEFEYYEKSDCPSYCQWITTAGADGDDDMQDGKCLTPGEVTACEEYYGETECPTERCTWYGGDEGKCWAKDKPIPCESMDERTCLPAKECKWTKDAGTNDEPDFGAGFCTKCDTADCSEPLPDDDNVDPNPEPDDGKPCAAHTMNGQEDQECPYPRCAESWGDSDDTGMCGGDESGGTCRDTICTDHAYDDEACKKQTGCTFDSTSQVCYDATGGVFPCEQVYEQDECPTDKCKWKDSPDGEGDGFCIPINGDIPCNMIGDGTFCETQDDGSGNKCVFVPQLYECVTKKKADDLPCTAYNQDPDSCPAPKCALQQGICWEVGKEVPCSALCEAATCELAGHCTYKKDSMGMGVCTECEAGGCPVAQPCNTYTSEETCPESHCLFQYNEDGEGDDNANDEESGECVDHQCVSMYAAGECTASPLGCTWDSSTSSCWPTAFSKPCKDIWDKTPCTSAGCDWNDDRYQCSEKGSKALCRDQYESGDCEALDYCEYVNFECNEKQSNFPSTPPPLDGPGDGTGNEDMSKCTTSLYDQVKAKLESAETECVIHGRSRRGTEKEQQLECLAYFLGQSPNPTTITAACPCLWAWATEIEPWGDHFMKVKC